MLSFNIDFAELSEAIALYFYLLRFFAITFLIMSVVMVPILVANYSGNAVEFTRQRCYELILRAVGVLFLANVPHE